MHTYLHSLVIFETRVNFFNRLLCSSNNLNFVLILVNFCLLKIEKKKITEFRSSK